MLLPEALTLPGLHKHFIDEAFYCFVNNFRHLMNVLQQKVPNMKSKITILALLFLLMGVVHADAQRHHYRGKKGYAKHGHYHKVHPRHYNGYGYRHGYTAARYRKPARHYHHPGRYRTKVVYVQPHRRGYYSKTSYYRAPVRKIVYVR